VDCKVNTNKKDYTEKYALSRANFDGLRDSLKIDWRDMLLQYDNDIEGMWQVFKSTLENKIEQFVPKVKNFDSWKKQSWIRPLNAKDRDKIHKKHRLWRKYTRNHDPAILRQYKSVRNAVVKDIRKTVRAQQLDIAVHCKTNPKKFWKYINSRRKGNSEIGDLKSFDTQGNDMVITSNEDKANTLEQYFSSVFTKENQIDYDIQDINTEYLSNLNINFTETKILEKLNKLNITKSPGPDRLHPRLLYEVRKEILHPLKILFDTSYNLGTVPSDWKSANITAIHKKGNKKDPTNYRPVSLTSIVCKITESIIRDFIMEHFLDNDLFSNKQYGFIKGRSTVLQLLNIMDD